MASNERCPVLVSILLEWTTTLLISCRSVSAEVMPVEVILVGILNVLTSAKGSPIPKNSILSGFKK